MSTNYKQLGMAGPRGYFVPNMCGIGKFLIGLLAPKLTMGVSVTTYPEKKYSVWMSTESGHQNTPIKFGFNNNNSNNNNTNNYKKSRNNSYQNSPKRYIT